MSNVKLLLILIVGLPLLAAAVTAALGPRLLKGRSFWPALLGIALSCACSLALLREVTYESKRAAADPRSSDARSSDARIVGYEQVHRLWTWMHVGRALDGRFDFDVEVTLRADPLTAIMLVVVTFVSTLVALYSVGYMRDDPGVARYFALIALFVFSMTALVSVSNFILLYVFWEGVGACSYLLIGFWFHKPEAAAAGKKAFLVNRVGDFGFALAVFLIWTNYGTLNFHDSDAVADAKAAGAASSGGAVAQTSSEASEKRVVAGVLGQRRLSEPSPLRERFATRGGVDIAICLLLLLGACGKSAQFPLHVWLPDAMEGPTPVSALIHAATMVTAGIYMVTRCAPLFALSPEARLMVSVVGGFTALLAGLIAITQYDLKRVLAYSTVSQLGFMFLALGTGTLAGIAAGMFHLLTHAFFKALLFLGAGSVMHAMGGTIDVRRFGGLRRRMPITCWTFLAGCLALAGFPLLSGFWSKDAILAAVHAAGGHAAADSGMHDGMSTYYETVYRGLYWSALATAGLTAFYTFRAFFLTFFGDERIPAEAGHHAHESPATMTVPLVVLSAFAVGIGGYFTWTGEFLEFLRRTPSLANPRVLPVGGAGEMHWDIAWTSAGVALAGMALAAFFYLGDRREVDWIARRIAPLYQLSYGKFFFDEIYAALVVWPLWLAAIATYAVDRWIVDGLVDAVGRIPPAVGSLMRPLQNGLVQFYALAMMLGLLVLAIVMLG